jgi:hypothetical protein
MYPNGEKCCSESIMYPNEANMFTC